MIHPARFFRFLYAGLHRLNLAVILCVIAIATQAHGDYSSLVKTYRKESSLMRDNREDASALRSFYEEWLLRFMQAGESAESDAERKDALTKAVSLANGLGNFTLSRALATKVLSLQTQWQGQVQWNTELGEISEMVYAESQSEEDMEQASRYFGEALRISDENGDPDTMAGMLSRDRVISGVKRGQILERSGRREDMIAASDLYADTRKFIESLDESSRARLAQAYYDEEYLNAIEMLASASHDTERAYGCLERLSEMSQLRHPPSYHMLNMARQLAPLGGKVFQNAVSEWLANNPEDSHTPFLMFYLARDYYDKSEIFSALRIYDTLLSNYREILTLTDADAIDEGSGGHLAEILYNLGMIYVRLEAYDQALDYLCMFAQSYPNDSRLAIANRMIAKLAALRRKTEDDVLFDTDSDPAGSSTELMSLPPLTGKLKLNNKGSDDLGSSPKDISHTLYSTISLTGLALAISLSVLTWRLYRSKKG